MAVLLRGVAASSGLALGKAVLMQSIDVEKAGRSISAAEVETEIERYKNAVRSASEELCQLQKDVESKMGKEEAAIFEAQRLMLLDPGLDEAILTKIREKLVSAEKACLEACEEQAKVLEAIEDQYLAARALDLRDIGKRLVRCLLGIKGRGIPRNLKENSVIVADDLAPSDTVSLDTTKVSGIVLDKGGRTSHTAILARSLGIPAVVGTSKATRIIHTGDLVAVDGEKGEVSVNPDEEELIKLKEKTREFLREKKRLAAIRDLPSVTRDGKKIELAANIGRIGDARLVKQVGAEGVGLFRTEFLFIDRESMPSEEEQFQAYKKVLSELRPFPVVVRTLDVGGDKNIPYLELPREDNPFLGLRAIRLCLKERKILRTQLRALLRASIYGNLRIMFPMISNIRELREAKSEFERVKTELVKSGIPVPDDIQVGIMVEIPSAAINADTLAPECDFFSIGTNDLVQYTMACDRGNPAVGYLSDPFYPSVLRLIYRTINEGHKRGVWVGMCGEMAGMPLAIPLLIGMGIDELSMAPGSVPKAKEIIRNLDSRSLRGVWDKVKDLGTADEVKDYLTTFLAD